VKTVKKRVACLLLAVFEIALGVVYGFWLQGWMNTELFLFVAFVVPFTVFLLLYEKGKTENGVKIVEVFVLSVLSAILAFVTLSGGNRLVAHRIGEYEVVVEEIYGKGGGEAYFTTPDGAEGSVDLHDYRIWYTDADDYVEVGDVIRVQEYRGLFDHSYFVFAEEVPTKEEIQ
jgi:hypothetical protein